MDTTNNIQGRYSEGAKTFLVTCPFCRHTTRHVLDLFDKKQWIGSYICYGGRNSVTDEWEDCGKELIITEIK